MDSKRDSGIAYLILGIYSVLISWYFNHSIILAIICYLCWPVYLVFEILSGHLAHGAWRTIPLSYFK